MSSTRQICKKCGKCISDIRSHHRIKKGTKITRCEQHQKKEFKGN